MVRLLIAAAALALHAGAAEAGDAQAGRQLYDQCLACHEIGRGAAHGIGPHLNGAVGRAAASHADFDYSPSLRRLGEEAHVWSAAALDAFLADPAAVAPDSRMSFAGIADAGARADLIAFLESVGDGSAMARLAAAEDHGVDPAVLALEGDAEYGAWLSGECTACHRADGGDAGIPSIPALAGGPLRHRHARLPEQAPREPGDADDRGPARRRGDRGACRLFRQSRRMTQDAYAFAMERCAMMQPKGRNPS